MTEEETLLLSWRNSLRKEDIISNDFSIDGETVILTVNRCVDEYDVGKSLVAKCSLQFDSINHAIEFLSNNKQCLIN